MVGFLIGGINGFLVISTLASYAFKLGILPDNGQFPTVGQALFIPPGAGGWAKFFFIENSALTLLSGPALVIALVVLFLFVIIAFI